MKKLIEFNLGVIAGGVLYWAFAGGELDIILTNSALSFVFTLAYELDRGNKVRDKR